MAAEQAARVTGCDMTYLFLYETHDAGRCYRGFVSVDQWDPIPDNACTVLTCMYVMYVHQQGTRNTPRRFERVRTNYEALSPRQRCNLACLLRGS